MAVQVEELADNKVRLKVDVPREDIRHAIEHATSDLAGSVKVPGFRPGKVPPQVLRARVGEERLMTEAVESHIGGWFWNAAASTRIRPITQPQFDYDLPASEDDEWSFTATVDVQPKPEVADWTNLEVPYREAEIPPELVDQEIEVLRESVADLAPVEDRPAQTGDVVVVDAVEESGEAQRDLVLELGTGRVLEEVERALIGAATGETRAIEYTLPDGSSRTTQVTVKEIKEKVLPPADDELARAASEFDTYAELGADIEASLREQLEDELDAAFRAEAVDRLVAASNATASGPLVDARARELLNQLGRSLDRRGISADLYLQLSGQTPEQLAEGVRAEAAQSVARELVLEAAADKLGIEVSDDEVDELIREQAEAAGEDPDEVVTQIRESGRFETLRADLRLKETLDRIVSEVKRISPDLADARDKLWTPDKETAPTETKLWTPASKEPA
ncbi:MAG: trigger factor [Actinomycetota bacterium]|nr:trigger factor [Actinomycetota bacterium]